MTDKELGWLHCKTDPTALLFTLVAPEGRLLTRITTGDWPDTEDEGLGEIKLDTVCGKTRGSIRFEMMALAAAVSICD